MNGSGVLVVSPHPDDEVLGIGGSIARFADEGRDIVVAIMTRGCPPLFDQQQIDNVRSEAREAHQILGVRDTLFYDFPSAQLDTVPQHELNQVLSRLILDVAPEVVFIPFRGDVHQDHQRVFDAAMVALRPNSHKVMTSVYAFETLSETNWNAPTITAAFSPDCYVRIDDYLDKKLRAMAAYRSQLCTYPHERSLEAVEVLARYRGATVGTRAAEAFVTIREVV